MTPLSIEHPSRKLSVVLADALGAEHTLEMSVGDLLDKVADRGFGLALALVALPTLIPILPPGASAVVGMLFVALGVQLMAGARRPWLPTRIRKHRLSARTINSLRTRGIKLVQTIERVSHERWDFMASNVAMRLVGIVIVAVGVLLFLPLPFMNTVPGLAMLVIGIGLVNRDGFLIFSGVLLSIGLVVVAIRFGHLLVSLYQWLRAVIQNPSPRPHAA